MSDIFQNTRHIIFFTKQGVLTGCATVFDIGGKKPFFTTRFLTFAPARRTIFLRHTGVLQQRHTKRRFQKSTYGASRCMSRSVNALSNRICPMSDILPSVLRRRITASTCGLLR